MEISETDFFDFLEERTINGRGINLFAIDERLKKCHFVNLAYVPNESLVNGVWIVTLRHESLPPLVLRKSFNDQEEADEKCNEIIRLILDVDKKQYR